MTDRQSAAAYGGPGWSPRTASTLEELGSLWAGFKVSDEYSPVKAVLLHRPGSEIAAVRDANQAQWLACLHPVRAEDQHRALAAAYEREGVEVHYVDPPEVPPPNLVFVADLLLMTPSGAILGRPASTVRAGEERWIAQALARLGTPILSSVHGRGTFEGADAAWINPRTALLATGLRTNLDGAAQVLSALESLGAEVIQVGLPRGTMHLMGCLRLVDHDLAVAWSGRLPDAAIEALEAHGYQVVFLPDEDEAVHGHALNFVTLAPRRVLMPAGNPKTEAFYQSHGIECLPVAVDELLLAAGGIGCMTGVLWREPA